MACEPPGVGVCPSIEARPASLSADPATPPPRLCRRLIAAPSTKPQNRACDTSRVHAAHWASALLVRFIATLARRSRSCADRTAFTLIELLVVIAIIGILIGLLLPADPGRARGRSPPGAQSNLHQLGIGITQFVNVHNGNFPFTYHAGNGKTWIATVAPFMENVDQSPALSRRSTGPQRVMANANGLRGTSYVINEYVATETIDGKSIQNINKMRDTHRLIVLFEGANTGRAAQDDHVHTSTWYAPGDIANGTVWDTMIAEMNPNQHGDSRELSLRGRTRRDDGARDRVRLGLARHRKPHELRTADPIIFE